MSPLATEQQPQPCVSAAGAQDQAGGACWPASVVRRIIGQLPLWMHGSCALVCRSWQAAVPDTRTTLAHWRQQLSPQQRHSCRHLAAGYQDRIRPWLAGQNSEWLPVLERQHQHLLQLQETLAEQNRQEQQEQTHRQAASARRCFAALVEYSLYQSLATIGPHTLQVLPALAGPVRQARFSGCSRWLAVAQKKTWGAESGLLRLYGWRDGLWQPESLTEDPACPVATELVENFAFSHLDPDRLISAHSGGQLVSWHRQPETGRWQPSPLLHTDDKVDFLVANGDGDLVLRLCSRDETRTGIRLLVVHENDKPGEVSRIVSRDYKSLIAAATGPCRQQMALVVPLAESGAESAAIHIWQRGIGGARPDVWGCVQSLLEQGRQIQHLTYSPDGQYLLGVLGGLRACLWFIDADHRLQLRLDVACAFELLEKDATALQPFHHGGKALVLAESVHRLQFYQQCPEGRWQPGELLDNAAPEQELSNREVRRLQWSADGQLLAQVTARYLVVWCANDSGHWQELWRCRGEDALAPVAGCWLLAPFFTFCTTIVRREGLLSIHGAGARGTIESRGPMAWGCSFVCSGSSPDGLSQLFVSPQTCQLHMLQLAAVPAAGSNRCAGAAEAASLRSVAPDGAEPDAPERAQGPDEAAVWLCPSRLAHGACLPRELLERIFHYLPLIDHSQCALVCRRWYASLPACRRRLARWLEERHARQRLSGHYLVQGYSSQSRCWLQAWRSPLWAAVERQYLARLYPLYRNRDVPLLPGLLHYAVHQQMTRIGPDHLDLRVLAVQDSDRRELSCVELGPYGNAIAAQGRHGPNGPFYLRVFSLKEDVWQEDSLRPQPEAQLCTHTFSPVAPGTLFSVHGSDLFIWRQQAGSGDWHGTRLWSSPHLQNLGSLIIFSCGDMMISCGSAGNRPVRRLLVFPAPEQRSTGRAPAGHVYAQGWLRLAWSWAGNQLAIAQPLQGSELCKHQIHLWHKTADKGKAGGWWCTTSAIRHRKADFLDMAFHSGPRYLLVLFAWGRLSLFVQDDRHRLQEHIALCCHVPARRDGFQTLFDISQDGQRLAVPYGGNKIQFWNRGADGYWQARDQVRRAVSPDADADAGEEERELRAVMLSANGRGLLCGSGGAFTVWQQEEQGWQRLEHHKAPAGAGFVFSSYDHGAGSCPFFFVAASDSEGSLWVYGPDAQGKIIRKAQTTLGAPVLDLGGSIDGLSLQVAFDRRDALVRLGGPVEPSAQESAL